MYPRLCLPFRLFTQILGTFPFRALHTTQPPKLTHAYVGMGDNRGDWCRDPFCMWEFPQIRGTISADPIIRTKVFWGLYVGPPILGNYHFERKETDLCFWLSEPTPRCNPAPSSTPCLARNLGGALRISGPVASLWIHRDYKRILAPLWRIHLWVPG